MSESPRIKQSRRIQTLGTFAVACIALGACRVPAPVYVVSQPPEALTVPGPPPPPVIEVPPASPGDGYVWQEGYWNWEDQSYQWVEGDWVEDRPGMALVDASHIVIDGLWTFQPPYWSSRRSLASSSIAEGPGPVHRQGDHRAHRRRKASHPLAPDQAPHEVRVEAPPAQRLPPHMVRTEAPPAQRLPPHMVRTEAPPISGQEPRVMLQIDEETSSPLPRRLRERQLQRHPSYRGTTAGRPAFGDDPTSMEPRQGYRLDHTGAIILSSRRGSSPGRRRSGSLEVIRRDPTDRFRQRESEGGRPPRTVVVRPDPRPRPMEQPRINASHGHRVRGSSAGIRPGDISRSRSAMRQVSRTPPPVPSPRPARITRSASFQPPRAVRQPVARPAPRPSAPSPRRVAPQRSSNNSTASSPRPSRREGAPGVSTHRRRNR